MISLFIGAAHAAGAEAASDDVAFPPFNASTFAGQIFWLVIAFAVLYYLMSKVALPRIAATLQGRAAKIDGDLKAAANLQDKAKAAGEAYEKLLADAKANAQGIGQKAKDDAAVEADGKRRAVEADMARKVAASEASIATARGKAMGNVDAIAADTAAEIVKRITGVAPRADELKGAVSAARS
jgi:F-type H+-transporting ATPase subunit b